MIMSRPLRRLLSESVQVLGCVALVPRGIDPPIKAKTRGSAIYELRMASCATRPRVSN